MLTVAINTTKLAIYSKVLALALQFRVRQDWHSKILQTLIKALAVSFSVFITDTWFLKPFSYDQNPNERYLGISKHSNMYVYNKFTTV